MKRIASIDEMNTPAFREAMHEINETGRRARLRVIEATTRLWEYPFCWFTLQRHVPPGGRILDVGTERSPFPFFLARRGYRVTITDVEKRWTNDWDSASRVLSVDMDQAIGPAEKLPFPDATFDAYLSVSVIEHTRFKEEKLKEAARVLKPGGLLLLTFDVFEEELGMVYPKEFGSALSMLGFDALFDTLPCFRPLQADLSWNTENISAFLAWHHSTKPIHRYVVGAAAFIKNGHPPVPRSVLESFRLDMKLLHAYRIAPWVHGVYRRIYLRVLRGLSG